MERKVFAKGYNGYKLIWIFLTCSFLGAMVEMVWCYLTMGKLMSRSSLVYGQFSVVWGLGCVLLTVLFHYVENKSEKIIFYIGTLVGGLYEYMCSLVAENLFGVKFWDYSHLPFHIEGRINLLFCFFWGLIAVVWIQKIYPFLSQCIEKIPAYIGKPLTCLCVIFLIYDICLSSMALMRSYQRQQHIPAHNYMEQYLDQNFDDVFLTKRYQNMKSLY